MRSDNWFIRIKNILSPIVIYLVITFVVEFVSMFAASFYIQIKMGVNSLNDYEAFANSLIEMINKWALAITGIAALIFIPVLIRMYINDSRRLIIKQPEIYAWGYALIPLLGIFSCFLLNGLLSISGLSALLQEGYEDTAESIYGSQLWMQYLVAAIIIPVMEEFLFRGIIFRRMRTYAIFSLSALVSAAIFGIYHMNLLQFIYATCLGVLLAFVYEKFRTIIAPVILHAAANAFSILITTNTEVAELIAGDEKRVVVSLVLSLIGTVMCIVLVNGFIYCRSSDDNSNKG